MLPASVQVCPVEVPGRGRRESEPAINNVRDLARLLARGLPLSDKPYAIFGTCLGAIVGYEIAREVEESRCAPMPVALFTAAVSPPHLYAVAVIRLYMQRKLGEPRPDTMGLWWPYGCTKPMESAQALIELLLPRLLQAATRHHLSKRLSRCCRAGETSPST